MWLIFLSEPAYLALLCCSGVYNESIYVFEPPPVARANSLFHDNFYNKSRSADIKKKPMFMGFPLIARNVLQRLSFELTFLPLRTANGKKCFVRFLPQFPTNK